jgi:hypothetical protein
MDVKLGYLVPENRVLRRIFAAKEGKLRGSFKKCCPAFYLHKI